MPAIMIDGSPALNATVKCGALFSVQNPKPNGFFGNPKNPFAFLGFETRRQHVIFVIPKTQKTQWVFSGEAPKAA